jgi:histidinol-phosphate aminotransferase
MRIPPKNTDHGSVHDLRFHGDEELAPGLVDLAVNVRRGPRPDWLTTAILRGLDEISQYPDAAPARRAVAARHGRPEDEVLLTAGAAPVFTLLARALTPRRAVVVHPQFTEPEAAMRVAGHRVERLLLAEASGFRLDPAQVPVHADLVVLGNPTNPTSVLHPAPDVAALARPGRVLVVDEAFADTVPGEPASLSGRRDLPGLLVVRSFTKTWGLAGLRIGYALGSADLIARLGTVCPPWMVSTPALAAAVACAGPVAVAAERAIAEQLAAERAHLVAGLSTIDGVVVVGEPASSFVLIRVPGGAAVRASLRERGFAVRRGGTFPGLGQDHLRVSVRDTATTDAFIAALVAAVRKDD